MNLNAFLLIITGLMVVLGGGVSIWSHIDTKRKYGGRQAPAGEALEDDEGP